MEFLSVAQICRVLTIWSSWIDSCVWIGVAVYTVYSHERGLFWCVLIKSRNYGRNKHQLTLEWAHSKFVTLVHALFYFLCLITIPQMTKKDELYTLHRSSHDLFTFWWWRHNRLLSALWDPMIVTRVHVWQGWCLTRWISIFSLWYSWVVM